MIVEESGFMQKEGLWSLELCSGERTVEKQCFQRRKFCG